MISCENLFYCSSQDCLPNALLLLVLRLQQRDRLPTRAHVTLAAKEQAQGQGQARWHTPARQPGKVLDEAALRRLDAAVDVDSLRQEEGVSEGWESG